MPEPEIDLRGICRNPHRFVTHVYYKDDLYNQHEWLRLGEASLNPLDRADEKKWYLAAHLEARNEKEGVPTDFEHDPAYACRIPLIGVELRYISGHNVFVSAWVDPNAASEFHDDFHVPTSADYDPRNHPDAVMCKDARCCDGPVKDGYGPHIIVPQGFYVPPFDAEMYEKFRGKHIQIVFVVND